MKRGWSLVNRCNLCKDSEESTDHILIHCDKTRQLWTLLLTTFGLVWVFMASVRNLLLEWKFRGLGRKKRAVWWLAPICLFWCIWGKRNQRTFEDEELLDQRLKDLFLQSLVEWSQPLISSKGGMGFACPFKNSFFLLGKRCGVKFLLLIC